MKYLFIIAFFGATAVRAQSPLEFSNRFIDSEDRWVAFPMNKDSAYPFGFIYLDIQAGLTLNYEGTFTIDRDGKYVSQKLQNSMQKIRLQPSKTLVAYLPESRFAELGIPVIPDWLSNYKRDSNDVSRLYRVGFNYNAWNEPAKALGYLERAYKVKPDFGGLRIEMAFSYNALGQYDKAISILNEAISDNTDDCYLYKELAYAQMKLNDLIKAAETSKKAISICTNTNMKTELAYNMTYTYYTKKDKSNFKLWAEETRKWSPDNNELEVSLKKMEESLEK